MTRQELEQYRSVLQEIDEIRERLNNYIVCDSVTGSDSNYPFISHVVKTEGIADRAAAMRDRRMLIRLEKQKQSIEEFVIGIPDSLTRRIFTLRYIHGRVRPSWQWISFKLSNGIMSADAVRMTVHRYLKK